MREKFEIEINSDVLDIVLSQLTDLTEIYSACENVMLSLARKKLRQIDSSNDSLQNPFHHYVYAFTDPRMGETNKTYILGMKTKFTPFYIGKGAGKRIWCDDRNSDVENRILEIRNAGFEVQKEILKNRISEQDAYSYERHLITEIGTKENNGPLLNRIGGKANLVTDEEFEQILTSRKNNPYNLQAQEANSILLALNSHKTVQKTADALGISARTLFRRMESLKLKKINKIYVQYID